ncbi:aKG-HExxH-type peptide beta-hydroxylase [Ponticoccus litoralis]|uniref:HEXXH motif-containing putative peptide modification protein n=1 Tax=Ponticoccus litoralis TaxID=422297 RepID=A0AAW9SG86_9RHOB
MERDVAATLLPNAEELRETINRLIPRLETSLRHLLLEVWDNKDNKARAEKKLADIFANRGLPDSCVFAAHDAILNAALSQDEPGFERACLLFLQLPDQAPKAGLRVLGLSDDALSPAASEVLRRAYRDDSGLTDDLVAPGSGQTDQAKAMINRAREIMQEFAPDWAREFDLLVSQIYLATNRDPKKSGFGGATVFAAFGSILMNADKIDDLPATLMTLVHESSHAKLFLHHLDDPVILNDDCELYSSPLRSTPRPMEGIFHAAWVSARMVQAARCIIDSGYCGAEADELHRQSSQAATVYHDCATEIQRHARLTPLGQQLFDDAQRAMSDVRS